MYLLSAGGSAQDQADEETPATSAAHIIELTGGTEAKWWSVGPM